MPACPDRSASLKKVLTVAILLTTRFTTSPTTSTATATIISTIRRRSSSMIRRSLNSLVALKLLKWFIVMERLTRTLRMMLNLLIRAGTRC
ncbi:hypothetical protein DL95DRAFT_391570 [Leptodontidium sp. 2 PMI_412]|nr:hypothetical protein DL95DRAFT_391570 [Leptodontidium sp. 2 PMI_412]